MRTRRLAAASTLLVLAAGCQMAARNVKPAPLDAEGEIYVYLEALPPQADRLQFTVEALVATRSDGQEFPLTIRLPDVAGKEATRQRLLASGRVPPGEYTGVTLRVGKGSLSSSDGQATSLLVSAEPVRAPVAFPLARAHARVVSLRLDYARSLDKGFGFRPSLSAAVPVMPLVELLGFATDTGADAITVFDKKSRQVVAVWPTGRDPRGLAVDALQGRLYVALGGADEIQAFDVVTGTEMGRARLQPGDRPREVALTFDRRTLVVTCEGSNYAAFVDPLGLVEVGRARTGLQPTALLVDPWGRRAYAANQGSSSLTVLDVGARSASGTTLTDGAVARAAMNRAGDRLYLVSPTSAYLTVLSTPAMTQLSRTYVGFGAIAVHVDHRTDYVYVSMGDTGELQMFVPQAPLPLFRVPLPGPATWLAIDDTYDVLLAVIPSLKAVAGMELVSRKLVPLVDTGDASYATAVVGQRD
jgi:hypothetical protein